MSEEYGDAALLVDVVSETSEESGPPLFTARPVNRGLCLFPPPFARLLCLTAFRLGWRQREQYTVWARRAAPRRATKEATQGGCFRLFYVFLFREARYNTVCVFEKRA